ncbi:MAG: FIG002473: Protein YcaR in KDO2-Lipid A biosynthesis cluster, partial [uncultured Nocardioidaceae bacterium]
EHRPPAAGHHRLPRLPRRAVRGRRPGHRRGGAGLPGLRQRLPRPRRHPGAAGRRGPQARL